MARRARPLADLLGKTLAPALAARGFTGADLVASWPEIAGEPLATYSRPLKVEWPRRRPGESGRGEPAALVLRVESAFALEMQHLAPVLIERINAIYGWRCIGRLVLKQGPVAAPVPKRRPPPALDATTVAGITARIAPIDDPKLRAALGRLGAAVASDGRTGG